MGVRVVGARNERRNERHHPRPRRHPRSYFRFPRFEPIGEALGRTGGGDEAGSAGGESRRSIDDSPEAAAMLSRTSGHGSEERADRSRQ